MLDYEFITRADDLGRIARDVLQADVVGLDIESTALDPRFGDIRLVQLIVPGQENDGKVRIYVIDLFQTKTLGPVLGAMRETSAIFVVHNAKFEQKWMWWKFRFRMWPVFCTFRASAIIYNGKKGIKHDLDSVVIRELGEHPVNTGQGASDWSKLHLTQQQKDYAAEDVLRLLPLRNALKRKLTENGLLTTALVEFGVVFAEGRVELNGFAINQKKWKTLAGKNMETRSRMREELLYELPHPKDQLALPGFGGNWNVDSPQQMLASLQRLGLDIEKTPEIVLAQHASKYPLVKKVLDYRHIAQRVKTFGMKFLRHIDKDGRIHPEYYGLLVTGRYSANKSMQQIPRGAEFRDCFEPLEGRRLVGADYSGIEMRLCAEISQDPALIMVFVNNEDAHRATAAIIMDIAITAVTKGDRQNAKPVNFGLIYGMMPDKLVLYAMANYGVTLTPYQAKTYRKRYFERYSGIEAWHRRVLRDGQRSGFSRTLCGRIRYLDPHEAFNEFYNCLDEETEALTMRGWVRGFDLRDDDVLLTKNAETGRLEWQETTEVKKWPDYEGPLVEFKSRSFSAVSTPNHRWLVRNKGTGRDEVKTTEELSVWGDHRIHRTGEYPGSDLWTVTGEGRHIEFRWGTDEAVELIGWFLTDGYYTERKRKTMSPRPVVRLVQSERANPDKVARIDALMDRLAKHGVKSRRYLNGTIVNWELDEKSSAGLHERFPDRVLTVEWLRQLDSDRLQLLLDTMIAGDGHIEASGKTSFCAGTAEAAGVFQILCTLCGRASTLHERDMSAYRPESDLLENVPKIGTVYYVNLLRRDKAQVTRSQRREFHAKQGVWCPIVLNTFFVARREGHVYITGNTPVQGSGADALKTSLAIVQDEIDKTFGVTPPETPEGPVFIVHHVHDEIILEADDDHETVLTSEKLLHDGMKAGMEKFVKTVPVVVDPSNGRSWAEIH